MFKLGQVPRNKLIISKQQEIKQPISVLENQNTTVDTAVNFVYNENQNKNSYPFITATELFASDLKDIPTLVDPFLPKVGIIALVGSSDTGKSTFLRQLAYQVADGSSNFLGFKINAVHNRAIYVSTEDDEYAIAVLLKKQFGKPLNTLKTNRLKYIFETDGLLKKLDDEMASNPVDLVIIDAFSDLYGGDLNANNKVRNFLNDFLNLAKKHKCLIIFLHHTGKRTDSLVPGKDNAIGSQGFEAKMRLMIELRKDPTFANIRHICIVKGNYLPEKFKTHSIVTNFNEYMLFENLNCSVPFEDLAKAPEKRDQAQERAGQLREQDMSYAKISEQLKKEGYDYGKSTIAEWLKNRE